MEAMDGCRPPTDKLNPGNDVRRTPCLSPASCPNREYLEGGALGCLMSYGVSVVHEFRRIAWFIDRILKGADPGDLPVQQSTKFELVINLKTAKALGLTIPQSLLLRAAEVIE